jgi:ribosomal protein S6--L-glutamate ligase
MILSFHPCIDADLNVIVAGRAPGPEEESLVKRADAIVLHQGVRQDLYSLCRNYCPRIFPNYDHRFQYPGKIGDTLLFGNLGLPHPKTSLFHDVAHYLQLFPPERHRFPFPFPFVLKGNYSGEGNLVFKIVESQQLQGILEQLAAMEKSGMQGFVAQQWINHGGRDVRVVVLYDRLISYWRVQNDPKQFLNNLSAGAIIDKQSDPDLLRAAEKIVHCFCRKTGVDLAGIDLMFDENDRTCQPLLVEINYWFGRKFFGSSEAYYGELKKAVRSWLESFEPAWVERIS